MRNLSPVNRPLVWIGDCVFSDSGSGFENTLMNLISALPASLRYRAISSRHRRREKTSAGPCFFYRDRILPRLRNRLGRVFNTPAQHLDLYLLKNRNALSGVIRRVPRNCGAVICVNSPESILAGYEWIRTAARPHWICAMDEWIDWERFGGRPLNMRGIVRTLLAQSRGWILNSDRLSRVFSERHRIADVPVWILRKALTAGLPRQRPESSRNSAASSTERFRIAYAGSLHRMHEDAFFSLARAADALRKEGAPIELNAFLNEPDALRFRSELKHTGVRCRRYVPDPRLAGRLADFDLLLIPSSFRFDQHYMSAFSIQAKCTDYMASGRPILSFGPPYSANHDPVRSFPSGRILDSNEPSAVRAALRNLLSDRENGRHLDDNAAEEAARRFSDVRIAAGFRSFIERTAPERKKEGGSRHEN